MSILKIKDSQGNWVGVPTVKGDTGNGISSAVLNDDYTLTLTFTNGTTYTTPSIRGEKGERGEPATDMEIHICSASEYDAETRIPTITSPNDKTFYLVPTEDGTSPDLFTEWVYVNGAWEMFGSMKIDLSGYLTDVQINGTSIVENGVANVPVASANNFGVIKAYIANGTSIDANGIMTIEKSSDSAIKNCYGLTRPIVPSNQHMSTFYGLAKAAGDTTQSQSSNAVGTYTEDAKIAIQKMLGIYEAPWELISEGTFTNAEEADYTIATDSNGEAFELTDVAIMLWLVSTNEDVSMGSSGCVRMYYGSDYVSVYFGAKTITAGNNSQGASALVTQNNGLLTRQYTRFTTFGMDNNTIYTGNQVSNGTGWLQLREVAFNQIVIKSITGTAGYRLLGRRKWQ